jgi:DNA-binding transcriptional regulator LsrR (DeoR family)
VRKIENLANGVVFEVANLFVRSDSDGKKRTVQSIVDEVNETISAKLNREDIYPVLSEARRRGYLKVCPPIELALAQRIVDAYSLHDMAGKFGEHQIQVVDVRGQGATEHVAIHAARLAARLIGKLHKKKRKARTVKGRAVHVGFASGFSAHRIASHLADLLRASESLPPLVFHSLSGGYSASDPYIASVAFLGQFLTLPTRVELVGLFAPPFMPASEHPEEMYRQMPYARDAFDRRDEVDIIITALASSGDTLSPDEEKHKRDEYCDALLKEGWIGDIQYQPFSKDAPLAIEKVGVPYSPVTVFDVNQLVEFAARDDKAVILCGSPCLKCGRSRDDAVAALLRSEALRVWSHVVIDADTAVNLVGPSLGGTN